jgi:hypothetical protein
MNKHRPNRIPLRTRVFLAICALFLIVFVLAEVALGLTYLPGKRGGFLLSGIPTLMLAAAATALLAAALLTIVDHYDKRPNEATYKTTKSVCYKAALFLFVGAPLFEVTESFLHIAGYSPFPSFRGLASHYSMHTPQLRAYAQYLAPILENQVPIIALASIAMVLGYAAEKIFAARAKRFTLLMSGIGMMCMSFFWVANTTKDLMMGEVTAGLRSTKQVILADKEPAKFNAILLTHFSIGGFMLITSSFVFFGVLTNRVKPL